MFTCEVNNIIKKTEGNLRVQVCNKGLKFHFDEVVVESFLRPQFVRLCLKRTFSTTGTIVQVI